MILKKRTRSYGDAVALKKIYYSALTRRPTKSVRKLVWHAFHILNQKATRENIEYELL